MVRLLENHLIKNDNEIIITIRKSVQEYPISVYVNENDTIFLLKVFFEDYLKAYTDEQNYVIGPQLPYALPDDLKLIHLREEHRNLFVIIKEASYNNIPKRYLLRLSEEVEVNVGNIDIEKGITTTKVLDFRYIHMDSVEYIRQWMYMDRYINEIYVLANHPKVDEILYTIADNILIFPNIYRVHIQHSSDCNYEYPPLHNDRFMDLENNSNITRQIVMYLYQTLLTDQYREMDDQVELLVDKGVLANTERLVFHPDI
jgi:hypothetical protein